MPFDDNDFGEAHTIASLRRLWTCRKYAGSNVMAAEDWVTMSKRIEINGDGDGDLSRFWVKSHGK